MLGCANAWLCELPLGRIKFPALFQTVTFSFLRPILCIYHLIAGSDRSRFSRHAQTKNMKIELKFVWMLMCLVNNAVAYRGNLMSEVGLKTAPILT